MPQAMHSLASVRLRPRLVARRALFVAARVASASLALAMASQVQVPLWMTPVPLTAQPQMVLALAAWLGPKEATAALLTWWTCALLGAPVLAQGATGLALLGPTAGYLWSYLGVVAIVGRWGQAPNLAAFVAWHAGGMLTLVGGALGLSCFVGPSMAWAIGFQPFWLADLLKVSAAFLVALPVTRRLRAR